MWAEDTGGLPLPLGLDLVRRDLGRELAERFSTTLRNSIAQALTNEDDGPGPTPWSSGAASTARPGAKFVKMYVNEDTLDMGEAGLAALRHLYRRAQEKGLLGEAPQLDLV